MRNQILSILFTIITCMSIASAKSGEINFSELKKLFSSTGMTAVLKPKDSGNYFLKDGKLTITAKSSPWGAKSDTVVYKKIPLLKNDWTVETKLIFKSDFFGQDAGIYLGQGTTSYRLVFGRNIGALGIRIIETMNGKQTVHGQGDRNNKKLVNKPLWLKLTKNKDRIWGFYSTDGSNYKIAANVQVDDSFQPDDVGLCLIDGNPYKRQNRGISAGDGINGTADFMYLNYTATTDNEALSKIPNVYVRLKLISVVPSCNPAKVMATFYGPIHKRNYRFGITSTGTLLNFRNLGFHSQHPWNKIPDKDGFLAGQQTAWMNWSSYFAVPRQRYTIGFAFFEKSKEKRGIPKRDDGNVDFYDVQLEFASSPDDKAVTHKIRYSAKHNVLGLYITGIIGKPLKEWNIRTLHDYVGDRLSLLQKNKNHTFKNGKRFIITTPETQNMHCTLYDDKTEQTEDLIRLHFGQNMKFRYICMNPVNAGMWDMTVEKVVKVLAKYKIPFKGQFHLQLADEPKLPTIKMLKKSESGMKQFVAYLKNKVSRPQQLGVKNWNEIKPLKLNEVTNENEARLYYYTIWFLQESTADAFRKITQAAKQRWKGRAITTSCTPYVGFTKTLDYYIEARRDSHVMQCSHYADYIENFFLADMYRCASEYTGGRIQTGILWGPAAAPKNELSGILALGAGMRHFYIYSWPGYTEWGDFAGEIKSTQDSFSGIAKICRIASTYENYLFDGQRPKAKIAVLLSRSAEIWSTDDQSSVVAYLNAAKEKTEGKEEIKAAGGVQVERVMLHLALKRNNYDVDIIPEENVEKGGLKQYDVLYVYAPNLSGRAQEEVASWVKNGGMLFLDADAAVRDELNRPLPLIDNITGVKNSAQLVDAEKPGRFFHIGSFGEIWNALNYYMLKHVKDLQPLDNVTVVPLVSGKEFNFSALGRKEELKIKGSKAIATYKNGKNAIVMFNAGKGNVIKSGISLGASFASTAEPGFAPKATHTYQRTFSDNLQALLSYPCRAAGVKRKITCSSNGIYTGMYELPSKKGALILLGNYTPNKQKGLEIKVKLQGHYTKAVSYSGKPVAISKQGSDTIIRLDLDISDAIELTNVKDVD